MKKIILAIAFILIINSPALCAETTIKTEVYYNSDNEENYTMDTIWAKNGKYEEKVITVGSKLLYDNKINKRIPFIVEKTRRINATSALMHKTVTIYQGIFPYFDNDDELAYVLAHEISHSLDAYGGIPAWIAIKFNSKHYEYKSDLMAIDMMVKSGYNPLAAITCANKWMAEYQWDFGFWMSHPKTSKRLLAMYKYIRIKYPWALNSQMASNVHFVNFSRAMDRDIKEFEQKKLEKELRKQKKTNETQKV